MNTDLEKRGGGHPRGGGGARGAMGAGGAPQTATANTITLKGSAQIVSEFFDFAVNRCAGSAPPPPCGNVEWFLSFLVIRIGL